MTMPELPLAGNDSEVPEWWTQDRGGSEPEYFVYRALWKLGFREDVDFVYQFELGGGRLQAGGALVDFLILSPRVGIAVQSIFFHNRMPTTRANDQIRRAQLEAEGIRMEFISEEQARTQPVESVQRAIEGTLAQGPTGG